jgi:hypothetical protein
MDAKFQSNTRMVVGEARNVTKQVSKGPGKDELVFPFLVSRLLPVAPIAAVSRELYPKPDPSHQNCSARLNNKPIGFFNIRLMDNEASEVFVLEVRLPLAVDSGVLCLLPSRGPRTFSSR